VKIISLFGYSGSGKTSFIINAINKLKRELNYEVAVIKNVHNHQVDEDGKDSYKFTEAGAQFSIIKNIKNENAIFFKKELSIGDLINWLEKGLFKTDLLFIEGFRDLPYPAILCVKDLSEIKSQLTKNVKMISGIVSSKRMKRSSEFNLPIIDIDKDFQAFLDVFKIKT